MSSKVIIYKTELTDMQICILSLLANGKTKSQIMSTLNIKDSTYKSHLANINNKLDSDTYTQAVYTAARCNII